MTRVLWPGKLAEYRMMGNAGCLGASLLIGVGRQAWELTLRGYAGDALDEGTGEWAGEHGVGDGRSERTPAGQFVGKSEDVVAQRVKAAFVALGKKLGFVGGHVYLHRALGFAGFAAEAQRERLVDGLALEAFFLQSTGEHLPEQVGAAACGVLLLAGGAVAGTHDAALSLAAGSNAYATLSGADHGAGIGGEGEVGCEMRMVGVRRRG
jgi:hypothetical protein